MKNYNFIKFLIVILVVIGSFSNSMAQSAKIQFNSELGGFGTNKVSSNGRYLACMVGISADESTGALWDVETNETTILPFPATAFDVSNDGVLVGTFIDPEVLFNGEPVMSGGWWKDGVWHSLGVHPDHPINTLASVNGSRACAISADGEYIAGYVFLTTQKLVPCTWKRNVDGKYEFHKEYEVFENSAQGGRPWDMSDVGQVLVGWDSMSTESSIWRATMWTDTNTIVRPEETTHDFGYLQGVSPDGTVAVGVYGLSGGVMINSDNTHRFFKSPLTAVASNGMVTTSGGVWTEEIGEWGIVPYLKGFWDVAIDESKYPAGGYVSSISADGKHIAGCLFDKEIGGNRPFVATLEGYQVPIAPTAVNTKLLQSVGQIVVTWEKPLFNGQEILGYNVYRDNQKVNDELISLLTFTDIEPIIGANCYYVTAVYKYDETQKESSKSVESCIEFIDVDGCFSPKRLAANIIYNRTVNLSWDIPMPNYSTEQTKDGEKSEEPTKIKPLYLKTYRLGSADDFEVHPASDGNNIYVLDYGDRFHKYTASGELVEVFKLGSPILPNYYGGLTYHDGYYYTASSQFEDVYTFKLDLDNKEQLERFESTTGRFKSRLSYMAGLNGGEGGFELGDYSTSYFYEDDLVTEVGEGLKNVSNVFGTTYHDGKIYATIQDPGQLIIKIFDVNTGEYTNEYIDLKDYTNLSLTSNAMLGGITTTSTPEGILCLAIVVMDSPNHSLVFLQLERLQNLLGFNVYRDGVKINTDEVEETIFSEDIVTPGNYEYAVTAVYEDGCESNKSLPVNIKIDPVGVCNTPSDVNVEVIRNNTQITWTEPQATAPHTVIGYNVYCNDEKQNTELVKNTFFTHTKLSFGQYSYQVEAFYSNSCVSDKSAPITIEIDGFNVPKAPKNVTATIDGNQADVNWDIPLIGDYVNLRWYSGAIEWSVGEEDEEFVYVASRWEAEDLYMYFDYTLTDVEFYPTENTPHTFYVYVDGKVVSEQYLETVIPHTFNLLTLNTAVSIEKGQELMVAYKVAGKSGSYPIGVDRKKDNSGKGDLISYDGVNWKSLYNDYGVAASWAITIRLMPYTMKTTTNTPLNIDLAAVSQGKIAFDNNFAKSEENSIFVNKEVVGYNVYKDGTKLETVTSNNYKQTIDNSSNICYSVEALYTDDRKAPMSESACIYGECQSATKLIGVADQVFADLSWNAPTGKIASPFELEYYRGTDEGAISFVAPLEFFALIQSTAIECTQYKTVKLKSIEALVKGKCEISIVVVQDGEIIMEEPVNNVDIGQNNIFEVSNGGFEIDASKGIMVGLRVDAPAGPTIGTDKGPAVTNRGDIIGMDVTDLTTLFAMGGDDFNVNWNISANFEEIIPIDETVVEYNIYRDGVKVNTSKEVSFTDVTTEPNSEYEYYVTTSWNTGCESEKSNVVKVFTNGVAVDGLDKNNVSIFPNPAKSHINVRGDYTSLKVYNSAGVSVLESEKSDNISVEYLKSGIYVIELYNDNTVIGRTKLVITK